MARIVNEVPQSKRGRKKGTLPEHRKVQDLAKQNPGQWVMFDGTVSQMIVYSARNGMYGYQPSSDWEVRERKASEEDHKNYKAKRVYMYVRYIGEQS